MGQCTYLNYLKAALTPLLFLVCGIACAQVISPDSTGKTTFEQIQNAPVVPVERPGAVRNDTTLHISAPNNALMHDTTAGNDSTLALKKVKRHSPLKAALFSAALPGLGQGYNKKYWKIPIVYAGLGGLGYAIYFTASKFTGYRNAYRAQADSSNLFASYEGVDDFATLKAYRDYYKRYMDISAICTGVWYILNIVDAAVDAHLFEWNMRNDLNISWRPVFINGNYGSAFAGGVNLHFTF